MRCGNKDIDACWIKKAIANNDTRVCGRDESGTKFDGMGEGLGHSSNLVDQFRSRHENDYSRSASCWMCIVEWWWGQFEDIFLLLFCLFFALDLLLFCIYEFITLHGINCRKKICQRLS